MTINQFDNVRFPKMHQQRLPNATYEHLAANCAKYIFEYTYIFHYLINVAELMLNL